MRRSLCLFLAGAFCWTAECLLFTGCARLRSPREPAAAAGSADEKALRQTRAALGMVRAAGWGMVMELLPTLEQQPAWNYPGMTALAGDLRSVAAAVKPDRGAPPIDAVKVIDENPNFWRACYEIVPGDPLAILLHSGLLLAAGEVARADQVLTLAIGFGRMDLEQRKDLVRLQAYARLMLYVSRRDMNAVDGAALAGRARALLAIWPQSPDALAALAETQWTQAGRPAGAPEDSPWSASIAALRRVDSLQTVNLPLAGPEPETLATARREWGFVSQSRAIGDDRALEKFSAAAQAAGLDELALTARNLLAGRRGNFAPADEKFVRAGLQRLVGPETAERICANAFEERTHWVGLLKPDEPPPPGFGPTPVHPQLAEQMLVEIAEDSYWIESGQFKGAELANSFRRRGSAWARLLNWDEAVDDFRRALKIDPSDATARYALGVVLSDAGNFREADAMFGEARRKSAPGVYDMQSWGNHLFKQGRLAEAEDAFEQAGKLDPGFAYAHIMRHLARLRQGRPGTAAEAPPVRDDPWGASLVDFLAGRIDELTLFSRLVPEGGMRYSEQECELHFVLGELALCRGDEAEARRQFHSCLGTGISSFVEYAMAWHELRRIEASPPSQEKEKQPRDTDSPSESQPA